MRLEWLETNGVGGYAASTLAGAHSRRYHGLLVAATRPPGGRMVLLSKLDETLIVAGRRYELGCSRFPGVVHPRGGDFLEGFSRDLFPVFDYRAGGVRLRRTIAGLDGENATAILWEVLEAPGPFTLELRPFVAFRDFHALSRANASLRRQASFADGIFRARPYDGVPDLYLSVPGARFEPDGEWYYRFEYLRELERGLDHQEDLYTHGTFRVPLDRGARYGVLASTRPPGGSEAGEWVERERRRREGLVRGRDDGLRRALALAADQFVVRRGDGLRSVIAGYPWFEDWGRDAMVSLPGLCLATGRVDDARAILRAFAARERDGLIPNRFPDAGGEPEYNTVDAGLWLFVAAHRFLEVSGDEAFVRDDLLPTLRAIVAAYERGTRWGIREDTDGLLSAGEPGVQLTWMDAIADGRVVTPRQGKPVEVNALWFNALAILASLCERLAGRDEARRLWEKASRTECSFGAAFWNERRGCLLDVAGARPDPSIRPNQLLALSLPFPVVTGPRAERILEVVERDLLTPVGLRSLAPGEPGYRGRYEGGPSARDTAYHEGTAWGWLLGPYADALPRVRGEEGRRRARELLESLGGRLAEACVGSLSEIYDGDPPHAPRGCPAQAWSVAEVLRALSDPGLGCAGAAGT